MLRSEAGVPTFVSNQARAGETTVDLQWASPECYDWATVCKTNTTFEQSHCSDHLTIVTELDLPSDPLSQGQPKSKPNWGKTDWELFNTTMNTNLLPILQLCNALDSCSVDDLAK